MCSLLLLRDSSLLVGSSSRVFMFVIIVALAFYHFSRVIFLTVTLQVIIGS